MSDFLF